MVFIQGKKREQKIMIMVPLVITYTMITGTSSLSSDQALQSGTHPFYSYNSKFYSIISLV